MSELEKQVRVVRSGKSQTLTEFVDWLSENDYVIAERIVEDSEEALLPIRESYEQLFADFFDIDLKKIEEERRVLLEEIQARQARDDGTRHNLDDVIEELERGTTE